MNASLTAQGHEFRSPLGIRGPDDGPSESKGTFCKGGRTMGSQNPRTNPQNTPTTALAPAPGETGNNGPSPAEIRQRAFEIHIERGGIHGCDLDDWLQAEHELKAKYNKNRDPGTKKK